MHPVVVEDGELAVGLDRDDPALDDPALAVDPPLGHFGDPALEDGLLVGQRGPLVAQGKSHGRAGGAGDGVGRGQDDVERRREDGAVHTARRALVGDAEDGAAERLGRFEVEDDRQRDRVELPDDRRRRAWRHRAAPPSVGHPRRARRTGAPAPRAVGLELVTDGRQLRGEPHGLRREV